MMLRPVLPVIGDPENNLQETVASLDTASFSSNIELSMLLKARTMCMNVAQKQLRIIESGMHYQECPLPPPWYTVFCKSPFFSYPDLGIILIQNSFLDIHSCALVLLTVLLWTPSRTGSTEETPISAFNRCLAALHAYESQSRTARQCSKSLIRIKQALSNNLHQKSELFHLPSWLFTG